MSARLIKRVRAFCLPLANLARSGSASLKTWQRSSNSGLVRNKLAGLVNLDWAMYLQQICLTVRTLASP